MADVNLQDLLNARAKAEGEQGTAALPPTEMTAEMAVAEVTKVERQIAELTPEERQRVEEIKNAIDLTDGQASITYGVSAQKNIAEFADTVLSSVRGKDSGEVGALLTDLVVKVKDFDEGKADSFVKKIPLLGNLVDKAEDKMVAYEKLSTQVENIEGRLDQARMGLLKDIVMFDTMFAKNLEYFKQLQLYIRAGEEKLLELQTVTLPKLREQAAQSTDPMAVQVVSDYENAVSRFEKKVHDLKISKTIAIQTAPQIRLIQNNDKVLVDKVQSTIYNVLPLWKSQLVIALGLQGQQKVLQLQQNISGATNELLKRNAAMLKTGSVEIAREAERSIVDVETVKKVNEDLIGTLEDTIKIQREGREKRQAAEAELVAIEDRLKHALLTMANRQG